MLETLRRRLWSQPERCGTREELVELAGKENASTCWPVSFPTRNTEHNTTGLGRHGFYDTSRGKESRSAERLMSESEDGGGEDQGLENAGNGHGRQEEHGR